MSSLDRKRTSKAYMNFDRTTQPISAGKRPIKCASANIEAFRNVGRTFSRLDAFADLLDLIRLEFLLAPKFHSPRLGRRDAGLSALLDLGTLELRLMWCTALGGLCGACGYAKPQRRIGTVACISAMKDSALSRIEK